MSISELLHQLRNNGSISRFSGGWFCTERPKNRRVRVASRSTSAEVFESRILLAAAVTSSVDTSDDDMGIDLASADSLDRKISKFIVFNRWTRTATNGTGLTLGDPTTLTWSLPANGVTTDNGDNPDAPNNLLTFMDNTFGAGTGSDLTQRPWFRLFQDSLHRLEELTGLTYIYTTADDNVAMRPGNRGILNVRADVRIMGKNIDNPFNTLAYNAFPNDGDMTIDTTETTFFSNSANDFRAFRNVLMHEFMHGLGIDHVDSSDADFLIEPFAADTSDGPQLDDILAIQRGYGDPLEKLGGNSFSTAIDLGTIPSSSSVSRGTLGDSTVVSRSQTDFVSIDDESDQDFYKFTVDSAGFVTITLTPRGATYMVGPENGTQASFNSKKQGDLTVKLLGEDGVTVVETRNAGGAGSIEVIQDFMLSSPGTYFIQVTSSTTDKVQLYGLDTAYSAVPGGQILGTVFNDLNTDGILDSGESGVPDIRIFIDANSNETFDEESESFAITDSNGNYAFTALLNAGVYNIRAEFPSNLQGTLPESGLHQITMSSEEIVSDLNFGSRRLPIGTSGSDSFVLNYTADNVTITMATNGGPASLIGTFPLTSPLVVDGGTGTDSVRIEGTSESDEFKVQSNSGIQVNGHALTLTSIEQRTLVGGAGDDQYVFDTDLQLGTFTLDESGGGADLLDFSPSALAATVDMGLSTSQVVNANLTVILGAVNTFENASGGAGNDKLIGNSLNNLLSGNGGRDNLTGLSGNDTLNGGTHSDVYFFDPDTQLGEDTLVELAGQGFDYLDFSATTVNIVVDLGVTTKQTVHANLKLTLSSGNVIDDAEGGSGNDRITGNSLANFLYGGPGNDVFIGLGGDDELDGMDGNDTFIFDVDSQLDADKVIERTNEGTDILDFRDSASALSVNLGTLTQQTVSTNLKLTLSANNALEEAWGGSNDDSLTGNALANALKGGNGNDLLIGNAGDDTLTGGIGDDTYVFADASSPEADFVLEKPSEGVDILDFSDATVGITLNVGEFGVQNIHTNRTLRLEGTPSIENVTTGAGNDFITGNSAANILSTGGGNDRLQGGAGSDSLIGGTGDDTYNFLKAATLEADSVIESSSEGSDLLDFSSLTTSITLNSSSSLVQNIHNNRTLQLVGTPALENVTTGPGSDLITGNSLANTLNTGGGNDRLIGGGGSDNLLGGAGNDAYEFGTATSAEADTVTEITAGGIDLLDFSALSIGVTLNAGSGLVQNIHTHRTLRLLGSPAVENISTGSGGDKITGNALANILSTGGGNDLLLGGGGSDTMIGGAGNDIYKFATATLLEADTINEAPAEGTDLLDFSALTAGITLSASSGLIQNIHTNRTLRLLGTPAIENITTGSGSDVITGNTFANVLSTGGGSDRLLGGGGSDFLNGGSGNDRYVFVTAASAETDTVNEVNGGGTDTLDFTAISTDLMLSLEISEAQLVHTKRTLKLTSNLYVENAIGGSANDILIGNIFSNELTGNGGRDILVGARGRDSLFGGSGDDILVSGSVNIQLASTATITSTHFYSKLRQIWTSALGYVQRVADIHRPQAAGTGKVVYLRGTTTQVLSNTVARNVFADPDVDTLEGNTGIDLFFSGALDITLDRVSNEEIDLIVP